MPSVLAQSPVSQQGHPSLIKLRVCLQLYWIEVQVSTPSLLILAFIFYSPMGLNTIEPSLSSVTVQLVERLYKYSRTLLRVSSDTE